MKQNITIIGPQTFVMGKKMLHKTHNNIFWGLFLKVTAFTKQIIHKTSVMGLLITF